VAGTWTEAAKPSVWGEATPPVERLLIPEADPGEDLIRRSAAWGFPLESGDLSELSRFAGSLAVTESHAWQAGDVSVATRAYSDRRFLIADRVLPWAVPWLRAVAAWSPSSADEATETSQRLLVLGEHHRPAPDLVAGEGMHLPGHDGYGPIVEPRAVRGRLGSLWGGLVQLRVADARKRRPRDLATDYMAAASDWEDLADGYPGSDGYWRDLAARALRTARVLTDR
jgi:hypothetical protein